MVFQNYALYPHMTVFDNVAFPLKMRRMQKVDVRQRVENAAELLGITEMLSRKPRTLSGGQRQRVALGRALVREPKLFLFDEPLSNLDAKLRVSMRTEIIKLMRSLKATVVYVTHDQEEALTMGDRIALLSDGRIQQLGSPKEIYTEPANRFVARFIGMPRMNFIRAHADDRIMLEGGFAIPGVHLPGSARGEITVGFRPDGCAIVEDGGIPITVETTEYVGSSRYLHGKLNDDDIIVRIDPTMDIPPMSPIRIAPRSDAVHLFDGDGKRITTK
jgi:ABC-type sugar transport system ATPase subunit